MHWISFILRKPDYMTYSHMYKPNPHQKGRISDLMGKAGRSTMDGKRSSRAIRLFIAEKLGIYVAQSSMSCKLYPGSTTSSR